MQNEIAYFHSIATVETPEAFIKDFRLLKFALSAFSMESQLQYPARIKQILLSDPMDQKSLVNPMSDSSYRTLNQAFNFSAGGVTKLSNAAFIDSLVTRYTQAMTYEQSLGEMNPTLTDALYFERTIKGVTNGYQIIGDAVLFDVIKTALNIPNAAATGSVERLKEWVAGGDYTVTPVLDANYLNGVSTFDLVLISRHILGVQLLDSPYKMVAADVNNSRSITTLDLIQLRRLILAIDTEFANNTSWRFVPASYSFPVPTNPWFEQFPEVININDLAGNMINQNFLAVKIGDVNGSVVPNLTSVEDRTVNGEFALNVMDQQVKAGNEYVVTFTGEQMESIRGYQATLTFGEALELVDVVYGAAKEENFGMRFVGEGAITMSWNGEAKSSDNLFSLVFRANAEGRLSEMLGVSSR